MDNLLVLPGHPKINVTRTHPNPMPVMDMGITAGSVLLINAHGGIGNDATGRIATPLDGSPNASVRSDAFASNVISKINDSHNINTIVMMVCRAKHHNWAAAIQAGPNYERHMRRNNGNLRDRRRVRIIAPGELFYSGAQGFRAHERGEIWTLPQLVGLLPTGEHIHQDGWYCFEADI